MGTQQILMIVLSVIIVGAAVAVGIQMFDTQANNQTRNALVSDISQMGIQAQAWYRTPGIMGGPGRNEDGSIRFVVTDLPTLVKFINNAWEGAGPHYTPNGNFTFAHSSSSEITITARSEDGRINLLGTVNLHGGTIQDNYGIEVEPTDPVDPDPAP